MLCCELQTHACVVVLIEVILSAGGVGEEVPVEQDGVSVYGQKRAG
jgi:hypothetical protein